MISLTGLSTTALISIAAAGGLFISLLYLLRLRRRRVVVPFLPLWQRVVKKNQYQSLFQRLKRLISWLLQILFLLILVLALGDPRLRAELLSGRNVVVVIDVSASMQTVDEDKTSRLQMAQSQALALISGLIGSDRMMLVAMDRDVMPLTPFTSDKKLLRERLIEIQPSETSADLRRALLLAKDALQNRKRGEIIVLSDGAFGGPYASLLVPLKDDKTKKPTKRASKKAASKKPKGRKAGKDPRLTDPQYRKESKKPKARRRKPAARKRRRRKRRRRRKPKRRKRTKKKKKKPTIKLPPGLKKRIDVSKFSTLSEELRPLPQFRLLQVGKASDNVGIVALSARRLPEQPLKFAVYVELHNFSKTPASGYLELYADGLIVETLRVAVGPKQRWRRTFAELSAEGQRLEARLKLERGKDLLKADNRAFAILPKVKPPTVLLVSDDNLYLHAVLLSDTQIIYKHIACAAYANYNKPVDIVVFHTFAPAQAPKKGRYVFLDPPEDKTPFKIKRKSKKSWLKNPLITDTASSHPVLNYTVFRDINIGRAVKMTKGPNDKILVGSFGKPLIMARQTRDMRALVLGFSIKETDLPLRVAYPLFWRNAIKWLMRGGRPAPPTTRVTGQLWRVHLPDGVKKVTIDGPGLSPLSLPVNDGVAVVTGKRVGFYRMRYQQQTQWLAANLANPDESQIRPREIQPDKLAPLETTMSSARVFTLLGWQIPIPKKIWLVLLALAAAWLLLEWWTYNRRVTI